MSTKLIEMEDGVLVEVGVPADQAQPIAGGFADRVQARFDKVIPVIQRVCESLVETCRELRDSADVEKAELELGLGFEGEGNLYVTKSKASANLLVRVTLAPKR